MSAPTQPDIEPLWTVADLAAYLGRPTSTVRKWIAARYCPPVYRVGRELRFDPAESREWARSGDKGYPPSPRRR